jgi:hypothetical protein
MAHSWPRGVHKKQPLPLVKNPDLLQKFLFFIPKRTPNMPCSVSNTNHSTRAGKRSTRPFLSEKEAKLTALRVLKERSLSPLAFQTVNVLITTGVLTTKQLQSILNIIIRSLKRYHYQHLLNHLYAPDTLTEFSFLHALIITRFGSSTKIVLLIGI